MTVTVVFAVALQPLLVTVTVYVVVPDGVTEIGEPLWPLLQVYVPPPVADKLEDSPAQTVAGLAIAAGVGKGLTVTVTSAGAEQPSLVTVTVYVVVEVGATVMEEPI